MRFAPEIAPDTKLVFLDYETRSRVDLTQAGVWPYVRDESTEPLLLAVAEGPTAEPQTVDPITYRLPHGAVAVSASLFDEAIYRLVVTDGVEAPWVDLFQLIAYAGLPTRDGLDVAAKILGVDGKLNQGNALIKKYSMPDESGRFRGLTGKDRLDFDEYNRQDVRVLQAIWRCLRPFYPSWREDWAENYEHILRINNVGIPVDREAAARAYELIELEQRQHLMRIKELTGDLPGGPITKLRSPKIPKLLGLPDGQEKTFAATTFADPKHEEIRQIRLAASSATSSKLPRMVAASDVDDRIHDSFIANGARTGRMNSRGIQLLNLPRGSSKIDEEYFRLLREGAPVDGVGLRTRDALRQFIKAAPGHELVTADFNAIEPRVLPWLADELALLDWFREGADVYLKFAENHFDRELGKEDYRERGFGKLAVLSLGYGASWKSLIERAPDYGIEHLSDRGAQELRNLYLRQFPNIVLFWKRIDAAAEKAVQNPGTLIEVDRIGFQAGRDFLCLLLPSGRVIRYFRPAVEPGGLTFQDGVPADAVRYGRQVRKAQGAGEPAPTRWMGRKRLWFGALTNNVVQATAADVLMRAIVNVHEAGFRVIAAIHDEILVEAPVGALAPERLCELMTIGMPSWADGLPLKAEGFTSPRYRKG